ncbi:unnamed protein product [Hydatigera taeniaeformis]|uniref:DUF3727 domain-containing protein n=1 Tax=Hydatigena taeniaeformis TaxID=6205 RepID=A0A0R3WU57_HYDTA|nr:unnamed protein product [Hydatigera taeniaeformis]
MGCGMSSPNFKRGHQSTSLTVPIDEVKKSRYCIDSVLIIIGEKDEDSDEDWNFGYTVKPDVVCPKELENDRNLGFHGYWVVLPHLGYEVDVEEVFEFGDPEEPVVVVVGATEEDFAETMKLGDCVDFRSVFTASLEVVTGAAVPVELKYHL